MVSVFHIAVCRKPVECTVAANVAKYGVGGINIDSCRIGTDTVMTHRPTATGDYKVYGKYAGGESTPHQGRWPANIIHDGSPEVVCEFPMTQADRHKAGQEYGLGNTFGVGNNDKRGKGLFSGRDDMPGSAARFFKGFQI